MDVSIVIPTRDRPAMLAACLGRLRKCAARHPGCEIIAGNDGGPIEDAGDVVEVRGPGLGPGANRNRAAARARGRFLVFVDDDCLPEEGFLDAYLEAFQAGERAVYFGKTIPGPDGPDSMMWEAPHNLEGTIPPPSCNFAMSRKLFGASGGFDERFRISFEDMEFFSRLEAMGVGFRFVPGACVRHPWRPLPGGRALAARWEARVVSSLDYGARPLDILRLMPRHVLLVILSRFRDRPAAGGRWRAAVRFAGEFGWVCMLLPGWIARHRRGPRSAFWAAHRPPPRFGL